MKRRSLTLLICCLACLALASVGFAAWVITNDASTTDEGSIKIDIVKDARIEMTAQIVNDESVVFGSKTPDADNQYDWLKHEETVDGEGASLGLNENLTIEVELQIGNYSYLADENAITLTITEKEGEAYYAAALAKAYVAALPEVVLSKADLVDAEKVIDPVLNTQTDVLTCKVAIEFSWGDEFLGLNPIDFYNSSEYTKELGDEALSVLQELQSLLNSGNVNYILTIEAQTK